MQFFENVHFGTEMLIKILYSLDTLSSWFYTFTVDILLAHLSGRHIGELIVYEGTVVCHEHFQTTSSLKP